MPHAGSAIVSPGLRLQAGDHRPDQRPRREVLAGAGLGVSAPFCSRALVGVALHVGVDRGPRLLVDQVHDQPPQLGRVLDAVLRLAEDRAQRVPAADRATRGCAGSAPRARRRLGRAATASRARTGTTSPRPACCRSSAIFRNSRYVSCSTYSIVDTPSSRRTLRKLSSFCTSWFELAAIRLRRRGRSGLARPAACGTACTTSTPWATAAFGILIRLRPSLMRSCVTTVWPPALACATRNESAASANSAFAAGS